MCKNMHEQLTLELNKKEKLNIVIGHMWIVTTHALVDKLSKTSNWNEQEQKIKKI